MWDELVGFAVPSLVADALAAADVRQHAILVCHAVIGRYFGTILERPRIL